MNTMLFMPRRRGVQAGIRQPTCFPVEGGHHAAAQFFAMVTAVVIPLSLNEPRRVHALMSWQAAPPTASECVSIGA